MNKKLNTIPLIAQIIDDATSKRHKRICEKYASCDECPYSHDNIDCIAMVAAESVTSFLNLPEPMSMWHRHGNRYTCQACGFYYMGPSTPFKYCPGCGAKMTGGE